MIGSSKAGSLCKFFGTVFCIETDDNFDPLPESTVFKESTSILVTEDDVLQRLSKLNINKSEGPDLMHPRIIYELRNVIAYPLTELFNKCLESTTKNTSTSVPVRLLHSNL